jgi:glycosyltransferase involved in cell wall biosynthesis
MRIALCKTSIFGPISGADETLVTYASELRQSGSDITVVLLYPCSVGDPYYRRLRSSGVPITVIADDSLAFRLIRAVRDTAAHVGILFALLSRFPSRVRRTWQAVVRLLAKYHGRRCRRYFENQRFDVLHILTGDSGARTLISAGNAAGVPVLFHELGTPHHMPELRASYERLARITPLCTRIAVLSPTLGQQWRGRLPNSREPIVLPLLVNPPRPLAIPRRESPFSTIFGFAARLETGKGPTVLLDAFASMVADLHSVYLRIAGVGPLAFELRRESRLRGLEGRCEFSGGYRATEGCAAFLRTLDVFVLPTFAEGTPNSIIEAMAAGLPVIATSVGGIPDMVTSETGIIVPPGDGASLADAMRLLAQDKDLRRRMGRAAKLRYEEIYSRSAVLPVLLATYRKVAREGLPVFRR